MTPMSADHKAALAEGRQQSKNVRDYLEALESTKPKRGRKRTPDSIRKRLDAIESQLDDAAPLIRLQLIQERLDLTNELAAMEEAVDLSALEAAFVDAAAGYSQRKGITYAAWRELGVPADVLKRAKVTRGS